MASYLVTGGAGFIGSNIVRRLVEKGQKVRVYDDFSTGHWRNLEDVKHKVAILEGDVRDRMLLRAAAEGADYVLHLAAMGSVPRSMAEPELCHEINVTGTLNALLAARHVRAKRFVYSSSSAVYGETGTGEKVETQAPAPISPYGAAKLAAEQYTRVFWSAYKVPTVALRYFNVFGPSQDPGSQYAAVFPKFVTSLLDGLPPEIYGDGEQTRDFTFVENVVAANLLACEAQGAEGQVFNVACGDRISLKRLFEAIAKATGRAEIRPIFGSPREGDIRHSLASVRHAKAVLGYHPSVGLEEGVSRTVAWYKDERDKVREMRG
jgi:UDP-glucose 4-epimerase